MIATVYICTSSYSVFRLLRYIPLLLKMCSRAKFGYGYSSDRCIGMFLCLQVYCLGTILSMQISFVGFQPVQSSEHMAVSIHVTYRYSQLIGDLHAISRLSYTCYYKKVCNVCR